MTWKLNYMNIVNIVIFSKNVIQSSNAKIIQRDTVRQSHYLGEKRFGKNFNEIYHHFYTINFLGPRLAPARVWS